MTRRFCLVCLATLLSAAPLGVPAQTIRAHTRPAQPQESTVSETQAAELTLTVVKATTQSVQTWVRTAGVLDAARKVLTACVDARDGELVRVGQRVRSFAPESKSSINQAYVTRVTPRGDCVAVDATLSGPVYGDAARYVLAIIVPLGVLFAVPNEAIIEREGSQVVYVQPHAGHYEPRDIHTGRKGELYTEVLHGLEEGDEVVTLGSFFIDADYRLKSAPQTPASDAHHHH